MTYETILTEIKDHITREPAITDFSKWKDRIIFRIINRALNADLLKEIPHIDFLDLSITFLVLFTVGDTSVTTMQIHNYHLTFWDTDTDALFDLAKRNTPRLLDWKLTSLEDILRTVPLPFDDLIPRPEEVAYPMHILTNRIHVNGAGCILYDSLMAAISREVGDDLCILPSSVHEVLLIPQTVADEESVLNAIIRRVNRTQVPEDEILSDHVYLYSRAVNRILYSMSARR